MSAEHDHTAVRPRGQREPRGAAQQRLAFNACQLLGTAEAARTARREQYHPGPEYHPWHA